MKHFKKRVYSFVLSVALIISCTVGLSSCGDNAEAEGACNINAGVIGTDKNTAYNELQYGIMANINVETLADTTNISSYDIVYLEAGMENIDKKSVMHYVENGGTVVLDNSYITEFEPEFLGANEIVKLDSMPFDMSYTYTNENLKNISELLYDYTTTIRAYICTRR